MKSQNTIILRYIPSMNDNERKKPSWKKVIQSVLAAALGVQSSQKAEKDFATSSAVPYIIGGIIFTILFIMVIVGIVNWVLG